MSLREKLDQKMRWDLTEKLDQKMRWDLTDDPAILRALTGEGEVEGRVWISTEEHISLTLATFGALREAVLRLADEVDALREGDELT
jgi:hypothetical protein